MIRISAASYVDQQLALAIVESDRRYFEMAARTRQLPIGQLCWMPGLNDLAASCVVHRIVSDHGPLPLACWLEEIEMALRARSIPRVRIYLDDSTSDFESLFGCGGYEARCEVGFLAPEGHPQPPPEIELHKVCTNEDWGLKYALHEQAMEGPDGYNNQADLWVEMERRKCATGKMQTFLVYRDSEVVATVGTIVSDGLLRLKNIVVDPKVRRQGIALGIVHHLWRMAEVDHASRLGVFGMKGGKGSRLYRRAGLFAVTEQYEWSKVLNIESP